MILIFSLCASAAHTIVSMDSDDNQPSPPNPGELSNTSLEKKLEEQDVKLRRLTEQLCRLRGEFPVESEVTLDHAQHVDTAQDDDILSIFEGDPIDPHDLNFGRWAGSAAAQSPALEQYDPRETLSNPDPLALSAGQAPNNFLSDCSAEQLYDTKQDMGPDVFEGLALRFTQAVTLAPKKEALDKISGTYLTPSNAAAVCSPRVNREIWDSIPAKARASDTRAQKFQQMMVKGVLPYGEILTELHKAHAAGRAPDAKLIKSHALNGIALAGFACYEASMRRREDLKLSINPKYRGLCSRATPVTDSLFGDDIQSTMKVVGEAFNVGQRVSSQGKMQRRPYRQEGRRRSEPYRGGRDRGPNAPPSYQREFRRPYAYISRPPPNRPRTATAPYPRAKSSTPPKSASLPTKKLVSVPLHAGRLRFFKDKWSHITSDQWVINAISGYEIDFVEEPVQHFVSTNATSFSSDAKEAVNGEIQSLLDKKAIREIRQDQCKFISTIFTVSKKNGGLRPVINLKKLNLFVKYEHFKMETFKCVKDIAMYSDYFTSIDLKDAYFSIPIATEYQFYLCFCWETKYYCFQCLPFGLSSAPRVFTKVLKPVIASIRCRGIRAIIYLDDILIFAQSLEESRQNTKYVVDLLTSLGFIINFDKSNMNPVKRTTFLGFIIDSKKMTFSLPAEKIQNIFSLGRSILDSSAVKIREFARFIGFIVSSFDAFPHGKLHYRALEFAKTKALSNSKGDFDAEFVLNTSSRMEIEWWLSQPPDCFSTPIITPPINITIYTDASNSGWGAYSQSDGSFSQGSWSLSQRTLHINELELLAVNFALSRLCSSQRGGHIRVNSDNSTTVSYINKNGWFCPIT